jgi:hypothetical protein
MRKVLFALLLFAIPVRPLFAQDSLEGLWQGYDGEWRHVSSQLIAPRRGYARGKIRLAPRAGRALHQRSLHAHCDGEFLSAKRHRS